MKNWLLLILVTIYAAPGLLAQNQSTIAVQQALHSRSFKNVHSTVQNGLATLSGSVNLYSTKILAEQQVSRVSGIHAIRDNIRVAAPTVADSKLQRRIQNTIASSSFESLGNLPDATQTIAVHVNNGVVTLAGRDASPQLASIAVYTAANTVGVKGLVDNIQRRSGSLPTPTLTDGSTGVSTNP